MPDPTERVELPSDLDLFEDSGSEAASETAGAPTLAEMVAPAPANQLRPGERFGDFLILRVLGAGSFATVYLAHDVALDRRVALKVSEKRGLGEGQALAELEHEHIVQVHAQFTDPATGKHCLCLQYVPGTTLAGVIDRLYRRGRPPRTGQAFLDAVGVESREDVPFDPAGLRQRQVLAACDFPAAVCRLGAQLAEALLFAHRRGVLHCDVKPANVLVNPYGRPLLADFNVSVDVEKVRAGKGVGGTVAYMAPEQLALFLKEGGGAKVDERCDVYSLGVVLFEMLTGKLPFEPTGSTEGSYGRDQLELQRGLSPDVSWDGLNIPPVVERVLRRCLDPDPARRYADAGELVRALTNAFDILAVEKSLPAGHRVTRWSLRWPLATFIALTLLPHLAGSVINIAYNTIEVRLNATQKAVFEDVVVGYNLVVYPVCLLIMVRLLIPMVRARRLLPVLGATPGEEVDRLRAQVLRRPRWGIILALAGWLPGGIVFPLLIDWRDGPVSWQVYAHFLVSFTLSGLVALIYSYFGIVFVLLRVFYPALQNADSHDPAAVREELARAGRWLVPFQSLAAVIPLAGAVLLVAFAGEMNLSLRLLVAALIVLGMLGAFGAVVVTHRINHLIRILAGGRGE